MIRFSAGLVVVAIGVLIGGVATSKLSLVYVAIAVSAVALIALAIGVALKRDELFGSGPESAPAGAGTDAGMPADQLVGAGDVRGSAGQVRLDQQQIQPKKVPGPATAAFEAAAAASAAPVAAPTVAAPAVTPPPVGPPTGGPAAGNSPFGNPPLAHRRTAFGQAPADEGDAAADWQTRSPQPPWSSGDQVRTAWTPKEQTPSAAPPTVPQSEAAPVSPRAWGNTDQSPASTTRAGSGTVAPSWFDRLNQPAAEPVAPTSTDPAKSGPQQAEPAKADDSETIATSASAADVSLADTDTDTDDDDWPTRYSWLDDDETDEAPETGQPADAAVADDADDAADAGVAESVPAEATATDATEATATEPAAAGAGSPDPDSPDADAEDRAATADDAETTADPADETVDPADETPAVDAAHEDGGDDEPSAPQPADAKLVTVIPGVPRYHDPDCILIRFMDEEDIARKSIPEAKAANCTPCAACQPEG